MGEWGRSNYKRDSYEDNSFLYAINYDRTPYRTAIANKHYFMIKLLSLNTPIIH